MYRRAFSLIFPLAVSARQYYGPSSSGRFSRPPTQSAPSPQAQMANVVGRVMDLWPEGRSEVTVSAFFREFPEDLQEELSRFGGFYNFCKGNPNFFGTKMVNGVAVAYLNPVATQILAEKKFKEVQRSEGKGKFGGQ